MSYQLLFDGFEDYITADQSKFWVVNGGVSILPTDGRRGGACARIVGGYSAGMLLPITPSSHLVLGLSVRMNQQGVSNPMGIVLYGGNDQHAALYLQEDTVMTLYTANNQVAQSAASLPRNAWVYLELGLSVANVGGSYELRVNGSSLGYIPPGTGDTQAGSSTVIDQIAFLALGGAGVSHCIDVDDLYVTYGDELVWMGDCRVDPLPLTGNTTPQDWTPSTGNAWERLNAGDGYIHANTVGAASLFTVGDVAHAPSIVHGVCVRSLHLKDNAGSRAVAMRLRSGASVADSALLALTTTAQGLTQTVRTDPATGAAWTLSAVNAVDVGVRVTV